MNTADKQRVLPGGCTLQLVYGDITTQAVDAIVNAANQHLEHGGGLARAIRERGGPTIQQESHAWVRAKGPVTHESPAWTSGGELPAKYVIHAVGPVWGSGDEDARLASAITGALRTADELGLASIALPAISTGIFGFPVNRAAKVILDAIRDFFQDDRQTSLKLVRIVLFDDAALRAFVKAWDE